MKATKGNKVYTITEEQRKFYVDAGYDVMDDEGEVVEYGKGKTVPYAEYATVKKELDELKAAQDTEKPPEKSEKQSKKQDKKESGGQ